MAARSITTAALRHRPRQAALVVALAAVVAASAVLGPLYARAVEQSIVTTVLTEAPASERGVVLTAIGDNPPAPARMVALATALTGTQFGRPVGGSDTSVIVAGHGHRGTSQLTARDQLCRHLTFAGGRCPTQDNEVAISERNAATLDVRTGDPLPLVESAGKRVRIVVTVVGVYRPFDPSGNYWFDRAAPGIPGTGAIASLPTFDAVFTSPNTLSSRQWRSLRTHADVPLVVDRVDVENIGPATAQARRLVADAKTVSATATTSLPVLLHATARQRSQARTVVPLLAVQLALLGVVVLAFICAAATEQRRPEVALARLRGQGTAGAASLLLRELGSLVALGTVIGTGVAWLVGRLAAATWLAPGTTVEVRGPVMAAAVAALLVGLGAVAVTAAPTLRQPLVSLLRRVPPRSSALQVGLVEGGLVAAAAAGLVTLLSGRSGGVALLAPGLLAVAGGLLIGQLVIPVAAQRARSALRRGRVDLALSSTQVTRRPALRRLIAIITVACALLVFALDTWTVAERNRSARARVEAGAPVVLTVDAPDASTFRRAVLDTDPSGRFATPVVTTSSLTGQSASTTAVEPRAFARIAQWGRGETPSAKKIAELSSRRVPALRITGTQVAVDGTFSARGVVLDFIGGPPPPVHPIQLRLEVEKPGGGMAVVRLGRLRQGAATYRAPLPCSAGCLVRRFTFTRAFGDFSDVAIRLGVTSLRAGTPGALAPVGLGPRSADSWEALSDPTTGVEDLQASYTSHLTIFGNLVSDTASVQRSDVPAQPPVLVAGTVPQPPSTQGLNVDYTAPDITGSEHNYIGVGRVARVPRSGTLGVLVSLDVMAHQIGSPPQQTAYTVWLAKDDHAQESRVVAALRGHGVVVTARDTTAAHEAALAAQGPTLALRLALLAGVVAVILAAAVLVVGIATSGRSRARDLAALRAVGVPQAVIRRAAVREHLVVAVLGVVAGAVLGLVAAQVALPRLPLFADNAAKLSLVRDPAWFTVGVATTCCLALLTVISVFVGRSLAGAATPGQLRDGQ
ncbi:MAG: putative transport system permease protein [Actinomycetota bacterium]|nr:putative transport system permease protein [Actinomycetota bacterium]